ncbi:MAG: DUF4255 domain-containing protein [Desulfobacterales bacterium]
MSDYTVIGDVGETLVTLLKENMSDLITDSSIVLFSPGESPDSAEIRLMLFLYAIQENEHLKNHTVPNQNILQPKLQPLSLDLYYMLTPYPSDAGDLTTRTKDAHYILGRAMRIFYDYSILKGSILQGNLAGTNAEIRVVQIAPSIEEISQIWNTFKDTFYRLSVFYLVSPVNIDPTRESGGPRVTERVINQNYLK